MLPRLLGAIVGLVVAGMAGTAQAATLDFSGFASGDTGLSILDVGDATVSVPGGTVFIYHPGEFGAFSTSGGLCALTESGNCETDWTLTFDYAVTNLTFEAAFFHRGDSVEVEYYNGATLLGSSFVTAAGVTDLSGVGMITSLFFNDSSKGAGFGFGDFAFAAIPLPAAFPLFATALAGMGLLGWRRKRKALASV